MSTDRLDGRVVIVTGAGRGLGREYALLAARHGARVVVNDLGTALDGGAGQVSPADEVVAEIVAAGGEAVADHHDVADWDGAAALVATAVDAFGDLHVLINNAGIIRDRMLVGMTPREWDPVIATHLRGHFCTTRAAAAHWRARAKAGDRADRVLISTTSISGLRGIPGQTNYSSAKAGVAMFAVVCHRELNERYGVRSYAIAPSARTRLTLSTPDAADNVGRPVEEGAFDYWDSGNVAPFVIWLTGEGCPAPSGSVYGVEGDRIQVFEAWPQVAELRAGHRWTMAELDDAAAELVRLTPPLSDFVPGEAGLDMPETAS